MSAKTESYVESLYGIAEAEGRLDAVSEELFQIAQALKGSDELRKTLTDRQIPVERRLQVIDDLLQDKAEDATIGAVSMLTATGRAGDLPAIAEAFADRIAKSRKKEVGYVRSAVELSSSQIKDLTKALSEATGKEIELKATIDKNLLGGIVATAGDIVIDGSIKSQLSNLKETLEKKNV